nr:response regulator [Prevotella sp.]
MKGIALPPSDEARCMYLDKMGRMWIGTSSGLKLYDGYSLQTYKSTARTPGILPNNNVMSITEGNDHSIWIGTLNGLVRLSTYINTTKTYNLHDKDQRIIYCLYTSRNGTIWIGTDKGLSRYIPSSDKFYTYTGRNSWLINPKGTRHRMYKVSVKSIIEDDKGNIFVGTWSDGLMRLDTKHNVFHSYPQLNKQNSAHTMFIDDKKRLWIGTWGFGTLCMDHPMNQQAPGIHKFNNNGNSFNIIYRIIEDKVSNTIWALSREGTSVLKLNNIAKGFTNYTDFNGCSLRFNNDIISDGQGNIWIETLNDGIRHINTRKSPFTIYNLASQGYTHPISAISSMYAYNRNEILLALKPYGLALYNRASHKILFNQGIPGFGNLPNDIMETNFSSIAGRANGEVWLANGSYGVIISKKGKPLYNLTQQNNKYIKDSYVNYIFRSRNNIMFIGQRSGLSIIYPNNRGAILSMKNHSGNFCNCDVRGISEDHKGNIWVATENEGIIRISGNMYNTKCLRYRQYSPSNKNFIVDDATSCYEDSRHILWAISNSGGLFRYDAAKDIFVASNEKYGIGGDRIFAINEDKYGNLWLTTDDNLLRLSFNRNGSSTVTSFSDGDGLGNILFYPNATLKTGNELLFGNNAGFFAFSPRRSYSSYHIHNNLVITNFIIDDIPYNLLDSTAKKEISNVSPLFAHEINIQSSVDKFSIEFSLLALTKPDQIKYAYKLEGYDNSWHYTSALDRKATYENIPSGRYMLRVMAADSYGIWQEMPYKLTVNILPPFYATWWAYIIYLLIITCMVYLSISLYKRHLKNKNSLQMARVFTNITHELITPLTIITTAIDVLKKKAPNYQSDYLLIQNNITRLTRLLRQILEVRKSQSGELKLLVSRNNLSEFVRNECDNIRPMATTKNISLSVECTPKNFNAWFDSDKIDKIIYNLISNAIKYNNENGTVNISLTHNNNMATLTITDNGIGISKRNMRHLYHQFYDGDYRRVNTMGTGIGLSLTRELVLLHHGKIVCKSKEGKGTTFTITFPTSRQAYNDNEIDATPQSKVIDRETVENNSIEGKTQSMSMSDNKKEYTILLVEDNIELLQMMQRILSTKYNIITAKNGRSAIYNIGREKLDLVVSDIMMPVMDGIELTQKIKNNKDYAQLPVILLTAKINEETRNEAYQTGADDFLRKPFKMEDLILRIENILMNRKYVRDKYINNVNTVNTEQHYSNPNDIFVQKARDYIKEHITDSEIDRKSFSKNMCVSQSTLYNKLKSLTGQNITSFITSIRLREAINIARANPSILINEIAYRTGFNSSKYFTKCFKREYGMLLKDYIMTNATDKTEGSEEVTTKED